MVTKGQVNDTTSPLFDDALDPRMSVVGVGGAGCNVVSSLFENDLQGLELVAVNLDRDGLTKTRADVKVLLESPSSDNLNLDNTEIAVESARSSLQRALNTDVMFLVCGLGGTTGTGASPAIADIASDHGAVIIAIAVMPFAVEGRTHLAEIGLRNLKERCHAVLVVDNNNLLTFDQLGFNEAMLVVNQMIGALIRNVVEHLTSPYLVTLAEEIQTAARNVNIREAEQVEVNVESPSGVEAFPEFRPVGFDDRGFIGFA